MEVGGVENYFFTIFWGCFQNLRSLLVEEAKCRDLGLSSEFGTFGGLIVRGR